MKMEGPNAQVFGGNMEEPLKIFRKLSKEIFSTSGRKPFSIARVNILKPWRGDRDGAGFWTGG